MSDDLKQRLTRVEVIVEGLEKKSDDQAEQLGSYAEAAQRMALAKKDIAHKGDANETQIGALNKRMDGFDNATAGMKRDRITLWGTVLVVIGTIITALITTLL